MSNKFSQVGKFRWSKFKALMLLTGVIVLIAFIFSSHSMATTFNDQLVDAADIGDVGLVEKLLKQGYLPDTKGDFDTTALMRAAFRGNTDIIKLLIENGAYINAADVGGETALHLAAKNGHEDAVKSLLYYGAYIDVPDKEQWTPLMRATIAKQTDIVKTLIEKGADINALNSTNESVLVHAAVAGVPDIVGMILGSPKAKDISREQESLAVGLAKRKNHEKVEKVISSFMDSHPKQTETKVTLNNTQSKSYATLSPSPTTPDKEEPLKEKKEEQTAVTLNSNPPTSSSPATPDKKDLLKEKKEEQSAANLNSNPLKPPSSIIPDKKDPLKEKKEEQAVNVTPENQRETKRNLETRPLNRESSPIESNTAKQQATKTQSNKISNSNPISLIDDTKVEKPTPPINTPKTQEPLQKQPAEPIQLSKKTVVDAVSTNEKNQSIGPKQIEDKKTDDRITTPSDAKMPLSKSTLNALSSLFFVQIGTFKDDHSAEVAWDKILPANSDILSKLEPVIVEANLSSAPGDVVYRLRAGTFKTKNEADDTCANLRNNKLECYVVEVTNAPISIATTKPVAEAKKQTINQASKGNYPKLSQLDTAKTNPLPTAPTNTAQKPIANVPTATPVDSAMQQMPWLSTTTPARQEWKLPQETIEAIKQSESTKITAQPNALSTVPMNNNLNPAIMAPPSYLGTTNAPLASAPKIISPVVPTAPIQQVPIPSAIQQSTKKPSSTNIQPLQLSNNDDFAGHKEELRNEIQEMTRKNFFYKQGIKPPQRNKKEYDDFYKQMESKSKEPSVSEAVMVPDETYFAGGQSKSANSDSMGSWLNIYNLPSEAFANDYGMRMFKYDESLGDVQILVMKPVTTDSASAAVTMRVGPLLATQANNLCQTVRAGGFGCSVVGGSKDIPVANKTSRFNKKAIEDEDNIDTEAASLKYWINLGTFSNNSEAEYYWMFIKEDNGDVLGPLKYDISKATGNSEFGEGAVKLRTGPFSIKQRAAQICNIMRYRNIACLVTD